MGKRLSKYVDISTKMLRLVIYHKETISFHYETGYSIILFFNTSENAKYIYEKFNWLNTSDISSVRNIYVSDVNLMVGKVNEQHID